MAKKENVFLTDAQLKAEIEKCEYCEEKPCKEACPADCSPADFIMAVKGGTKADYTRAAAIIMGSNPLGGICGAVCPDKHCMKACVHCTFDHAVNIPAVQAAIIQRAKDMKAMPKFAVAEKNGKKAAVIGAGPAGYGAASLLAQKGYRVDIYEAEKKAGGMAGLIPVFRLDPDILKTDLDFVSGLGKINLKSGRKIPSPGTLLEKGYDSVVVAAGLDSPISLGIAGEEQAVKWPDYLRSHSRYNVKGKKVAIIGGGAVAADCAETAKHGGAELVEMFALENISEMPLTSKEMRGLMEAGIHVTGRTRVKSIIVKKGKIAGIKTLKVALPKGKKFNPREVRDVKGSKQSRKEFDFVIIAIGSRPSLKAEGDKRIFYAGDMINGPTTVVEAVAAGKNAALEVDAALLGTEKPAIKKNVKSRAVLPGRILKPVPLDTDFFGRKIKSPFLLSAAPPTDGYEQMKKAYDAGWAGGVMKTAFDNVPIHIPGKYMFEITKNTYGNCDNVSGHSLDRVCSEIGRLIKEYPDRLTMASTGGPVTGNDENDKKGWQSNTIKLQQSGVMGIEYSLSCPQGGDGTKGDIVSQDAELTAKIIDWVMEVSDPEIPKLFKLTAAVTSIYPIITAIKKVFEKYPGKKAGVTLANTFPTLAFREGNKKEWEEGVVVGMSGEGVIPISNLTLANVSRLGVYVSGNGGPMDYKSAADFLALGAQTVQFCTIVMKYGYGIIDELESGLSWLMLERGLKSVKELVGRALPNPITGFMELTPEKMISDVYEELCQHCGNCTRCPYMAITLTEKKVPETDASKCIGCSICVQKCFSGALHMRDRTKKEKAQLSEG